MKAYNFNISEFLRILQKDKKKLAIYCGVGVVLGLIIAFTTPKVYKSTVILAPEESGMGFSGSISSLASMVGMNMKLGQTGDAIYPEIYPDLVGSTDFLYEMFPIKVTNKDGSLTCDYYTYLKKHQKLALTELPAASIGYITNKLRSEEKPHPATAGNQAKGPIWLTRAQYDVMKNISSKIDCSVDKKTNVITISVTDQDPLIAATVADTVKNHLQKAVTEYRTKKSRVDLEYMEMLFKEARQQYDKSRQLYAVYADANQEVNLQTYKMKEEDLENDMQLKYNIYQQVVEQLQLAKAKLQERTPAFTVMQNAAVPVKHSNMPKVIVLALWIILAFILRSMMLMWNERNTIFSKPTDATA